MEELSQISVVLPHLREQAIAYAPRILLALVTLLVGLRLIKVFHIGFEKMMRLRSYELSLRSFLLSLFDMFFKIALVISVISILGVETSSFIAVLGSAGLAIGLALQGSLSNFAGGVMLLIFKPFKEGDFISSQSFEGTVRELSVFHTKLTTADNKLIILPNGSVANNPLTNFTTMGTRRADLTYGIGYGDDLKKAKEILERLIKEDSRALTQPAPKVIVHSLGDNAVNLQVRVWAAIDSYWNFVFDMNEKVKLTFDQEGISIPFPQRDVHIKELPAMNKEV